MANYNSGIKYNAGVLGGGGNYNGATYFIIEVSDSAQGSDTITPSMDISVSDIGEGVDAINSVINTLSTILETGEGIDVTTITATLSEIVDSGIGTDSLVLIANMSISDSGSGADAIGGITNYPASAYFIVTTDQILQPLGVMVLKDNRLELFPGIKENTEEIPGRHGEIDFGSKLKGRLLELRVASVDGLTEQQKENFKRYCAKYLNPVNGYKKLIFMDEESKSYSVKFAGKIEPNEYPTWMEYVIPFKSNESHISGTNEKSLSGTGTLVNSGKKEAPLIIEITGPISTPSVLIGDSILVYNGIIHADETLIIDTFKRTAIMDGVNELKNLNNVFPKIQPGNTSVTASNQVTIKWRDRW